MMLLNIAGCLPVLVGLVILNHRTINSKQFLNLSRDDGVMNACFTLRVCSNFARLKKQLIGKFKRQALNFSLINTLKTLLGKQANSMGRIE